MGQVPTAFAVGGDGGCLDVVDPACGEREIVVGVCACVVHACVRPAGLFALRSSSAI